MQDDVDSIDSRIDARAGQQVATVPAHVVVGMMVAARRAHPMACRDRDGKNRAPESAGGTGDERLGHANILQ